MEIGMERTTGIPGSVLFCEIGLYGHAYWASNVRIIKLIKLII